MNDEVLSRRASLRRLITSSIEPVLEEAGFHKAGRVSWVRDHAELQHVVALLDRRGNYHVQWGIVSPETTPIMWGGEGKLGDVGFAVMTGTPGTIKHPAPGQSFMLTDQNDAAHIDAIAIALADDLKVVEERLQAFRTRREVRDYLLLNRDAKDQRDFLVPANLPLKLFTAAALAAVDGDPVACELLPEVEAQMSRYRDELTALRKERLRAATRDLCP